VCVVVTRPQQNTHGSFPTTLCCCRLPCSLSATTPPVPTRSGAGGRQSPSHHVVLGRLFRYCTQDQVPPWRQTVSGPDKPLSRDPSGSSYLSLAPPLWNMHLVDHGQAPKSLPPASTKGSLVSVDLLNMSHVCYPLLNGDSRWTWRLPGNHASPQRHLSPWISAGRNHKLPLTTHQLRSHLSTSLMSITATPLGPVVPWASLVELFTSQDFRPDSRGKSPPVWPVARLTAPQGSSVNELGMPPKPRTRSRDLFMRGTHPVAAGHQRITHPL
jgi:hypothetical protein